jgi:large subunit ribosomal protein L4e
MRNKKYKRFQGPLFIYEKSARSLRNIPTLTVCSINSLNLLKLAPGGHVGRFCIWSYNSFLQLENIYNFHDKSSIDDDGKIF